MADMFTDTPAIVSSRLDDVDAGDDDDIELQFVPGQGLCNLAAKLVNL